MARVISRYAELSALAGHVIPDEQKEVISGNIAALKGTYDYYTLLMDELKDCLNTYKLIREPLQKTMVHQLRKMNKELKSKKVNVGY